MKALSRSVRSFLSQRYHVGSLYTVCVYFQPNRTYYLEDLDGNALKWCKQIEEVWKRYYGDDRPSWGRGCYSKPEWMECASCLSIYGCELEMHLPKYEDEGNRFRGGNYCRDCPVSRLLFLDMVLLAIILYTLMYIVGSSSPASLNCLCWWYVCAGGLCFPHCFNLCQV